jgi:sarcosine oxidase
MTGEVTLIDPASDPALHAAVLGMIELGTRTRLDARDLAERFPGVRCPEGFLATYEAEAGFIRSELGITTHVAQARRHGATVREQEEVLNWAVEGDGVRVETRQGSYRAGQLVITTGPWAAELLAGLNLPLQVKRAVNGYFQPSRPEWWSVEQGAPDFQLDVPEGSYYGMPAVAGVDLKIGLSAHEPTTARTVRRTIDAEEIERLRRVLDTYLPGASGPLTRQITCMCTYTPDHDFVIGRHPDHEPVLLACGFSGAGYKFSPVMGQVLADLALRGTTEFDIRALSPDRFRAAAA